MRQFKQDFSDFGENIWLNAASEGPLPLVAQKKLLEAVEWKARPYELTMAKFISVPLELKKSIARLMRVNYKDVILANSASYGVHMLANGLPWRRGDEILVMQNDFPTNILPWLALEERKVRVKQISAQDKILTPMELSKNLTPGTKLFCISHVHTFSGHSSDIKKLGQMCRARGVIFVVNLSQSLGTMPIDMEELEVDAIVCAGYKWLCGPYGTGFFWMKPDLRNRLVYNQVYWTLLTDDVLQKEDKLLAPLVNDARKYDVFGTANFFNFIPLSAAIDYWLDIGIDQVQNYHQQLIDVLEQGLNYKKYDLISPHETRKRSSLVVLSHKQKEKNKIIHERLKEQKIYTAFWKGHLRISPHVYNTTEEIETLVNVLNGIK